MNRAEFRAAGLQGRTWSTEVFEPVNWLERLKARLPKWLRVQPRMRSVGWRGRRIGAFLSSAPLFSHRLAARREAHAKIERLVTNRPVRGPSRARRKRTEQRLRAQGAIR
jgi:hypothetical protein